MESKPASGPSFRRQARVVVAQRAQVELLHPAARVVHERQPVQERRLERERLAAVGSAARAQPVEGGRDLGVRPGLGAGLLQPVVGGAAAQVVEGGVPALERLQELLEAGDRRVPPPPRAVRPSRSRRRGSSTASARSGRQVG